MGTGNDTSGDTRTMKASEFKAKCLQLMDEVADGGGEIVITKNGKPVSRLVPYRERPQVSLRRGPWQDEDRRRHHQSHRRRMGSGDQSGQGTESMILADTHALLWLRTGEARLGAGARRTLDEALRGQELAVSAMTFWEVAMLKSKGRLDFPEDVEAVASRSAWPRSRGDPYRRRDRNPRQRLARLSRRPCRPDHRSHRPGRAPIVDCGRPHPRMERGPQPVGCEGVMETGTRHAREEPRTRWLAAGAPGRRAQAGVWLFLA